MKQNMIIVAKIRFLFVLFLWFGSIPGPDITVAWRFERGRNCPASRLAGGSFTSPFLSNLFSIRGGEVLHLHTLEEVEKIVANNANNNDQLVVMYFASTDCPPCKKVAPLFEEISETFEEKDIIFCKVNVDDNPLAASKYQVTGWPTFLFMKKGEKITEVVGGKLAEATLYDWVKLMAPKEHEENNADNYQKDE